MKSYNNLNELLKELEVSIIFDIREIVGACAGNGLVISEVEAYRTWKKYSNDLAAVWLELPRFAENDYLDIDEVTKIIQNYLNT